MHIDILGQWEVLFCDYGFQACIHWFELLYVTYFIHFEFYESPLLDRPSWRRHSQVFLRRKDEPTGLRII